jgi:hypothetical protein
MTLDLASAWAHRDHVLELEQQCAAWPDSETPVHEWALLHAIWQSSDDVPALLDEITRLKREIVGMKRELASSSPYTMTASRCGNEHG